VAARDAGLGSTHATIRDHADRDGRTHGRGDDPPGDHAKVDHRPQSRDRREREGHDAQAQGGLEETRSAQGCDHPQAHHGSQGHHAEVAEARRRREEGSDHEEAQDGDAEDRSTQGCKHQEAHHRAEGQHAEVAEACRRCEEGSDHEEAQDGDAEDRSTQGCKDQEAHYRAQGCNQQEAHHRAQGHHAEVTEACRRGEEGCDREEAQDSHGAEVLEYTDAQGVGTQGRVPPSPVVGEVSGTALHFGPGESRLR
jgi:hypothetical protein